jgi:hypothetical protein
MPMRKGEKYECTNPECGCEISVTKGSEAPEADRSPLCCCGEDMVPMKRASAGSSRSGDREEY